MEQRANYEGEMGRHSGEEAFQARMNSLSPGFLGDRDAEWENRSE